VTTLADALPLLLSRPEDWHEDATFAAEDWENKPGPRSKRRWVHKGGRVVYSDTNPGGGKGKKADAAPEKPETPPKPEVAAKPGKAPKATVEAALAQVDRARKDPEVAKALVADLMKLTRAQLLELQAGLGLSGKGKDTKGVIAERVKGEAERAAPPAQEDDEDLDLDLSDIDLAPLADEDDAVDLGLPPGEPEDRALDFDGPDLGGDEAGQPPTAEQLSAHAASAAKAAGPKAVKALRGYTGDDYRAVNDLLWNGGARLKPGDRARAERSVRDLDSLFDAAGDLAAAVTVYRNVGNTSDVSGEQMKAFRRQIEAASESGEPLRFKGFSSTGLTTRSLTGSAYTVNFKIRTRRGVYVNGVVPDNAFAEEEELLLPRDMEFRVVGSEDVDDPHVPGGKVQVFVLEEARRG
jgi:hypothetical protein